MAHQGSLRILFVEDDAVLRSVITRNLEARGHQVLQSETAADALTKIVEEQVDLILLDILLPDRSGWDVLRRLERYQQEIPVVIISAIRVSPERLREFRPVAYLPKPFPLEALLRVIEGYGADTSETRSTEDSATAEGAFAND
jgi:DNA-binding response OmpR family regulator